MRIDKSPYKATLYIWNGVSAFFFYSNLTPFHSHNTLQLVFDIRAKFKCRTPGAEWRLYKSVIIRENAVHQIDTNGSVQLLLYLDAANDIATAIRAKYLQQNDIGSPGLDILDIVKPGELEQCLIEPNPELLEKIVFQLVNNLAGGQPPVSRDERIVSVCRLLAAGPAEMTIRRLADTVFLSESRLRSLFKKNTGVSLHRYIICNRIMVAITSIMNGATIAEAAMSCGFSDTSHFHKMLLQMFGVSPSQFIKENNRKVVHIRHHYPLYLETRSHNAITWEIEKVYKL
jgi:AraC-like DNA-binding protein